MPSLNDPAAPPLTGPLHGLPPQRWLRFRATTPAGARIAGYHCRSRKAGPLAGALAISHVDGEPCPQLLPGTSEIPYPEQRPISLPQRPRSIVFTRKLDGTAILVSCLRHPSGDREVFARTRGMPVLQDSPWRPWEALVKEAAGEAWPRIAAACERAQGTLAFELWGRRNPHIVSYDEPLRLTLHSLVRDRAVASWDDTAQAGRGLDMVPVLARLTRPSLESIRARGAALARELGSRNDARSGRYREEGAVLSLGSARTAALWKFKPEDMSEMHRIGRRKLRPLTIRHELHKLLELDAPPNLQRLRARLEDAYGADEREAAESLIAAEYWRWCAELGISGAA